MIETSLSKGPNEVETLISDWKIFYFFNTKMDNVHKNSYVYFKVNRS